VGTAYVGDRLGKRVAVRQQVGDARVAVGQRQQEMLGRDVLVRERGHLLLGALQRAHELLRGPDLGLVGAADRRQRRDRLLDRGAQRGQVRPDFLDHGRDEAVLLIQQRRQQVNGRNLGVARFGRDSLRGCNGLLGLYCESIRLHLRSRSIA
jgi:hypothetical protein